jgi:hypothetical protein
LGMPRAPDGLSGERAEEGFYLALMERIRTGVPPTGLRCVGDCKRKAWEPRAALVGHPDVSVSPLP